MDEDRPEASTEDATIVRPTNDAVATMSKIIEASNQASGPVDNDERTPLLPTSPISIRSVRPWSEGSYRSSLRRWLAHSRSSSRNGSMSSACSCRIWERDRAGHLKFCLTCLWGRFVNGLLCGCLWRKQRERVVYEDRDELTEGRYGGRISPARECVIAEYEEDDIVEVTETCYLERQQYIIEAPEDIDDGWRVTTASETPKDDIERPVKVKR